jgi:hypothetical protein
METRERKELLTLKMNCFDKNRISGELSVSTNVPQDDFLCSITRIELPMLSSEYHVDVIEENGQKSLVLNVDGNEAAEQLIKQLDDVVRAFRMLSSGDSNGFTNEYGIGN